MATVQNNGNGTLTVTFRDNSTATFKAPGLIVLKQALVASRKDPNGFADVLVANCLETGNKQLTQNLGYLKQLNEVTDEVFGKVGCTLTWQGSEAWVEFTDGQTLTLKPADRNTYSTAQAKGKQNPLNYLLHIVTACKTDGDDITNSPGHLLGFAEVADDFLEYTGQELGN